MNYTGDAAEQIVRMSLEGVEVAARITGSAAKEIAVMLAAALKKKGSTLKTRGKERLTAMLKSGKALEIFSVKESDLKMFAQGAKQYGIVYCVLRHTENSPDGLCDVMVKADDAPRISRIIERFQFGTVDKAKIESEIIQERAEREHSPNADDTPGAETGARSDAGLGSEPDAPDISEAEKLADDIIGSPEGRAEPDMPAPAEAAVKEATDNRPLAAESPNLDPRPLEHTSEPKENSEKDTLSRPPEPTDLGKPSLSNDQPVQHKQSPELVSDREILAEKGAMIRQSVREELREIKAEHSVKEAQARRRNEMLLEGKRKQAPSTMHRQPPGGGRNNIKKSKGAR